MYFSVDQCFTVYKSTLCSASECDSGPGVGYPGDSIQLRLSGAYNVGVNQGSALGTYKLLIDAYNNDGGIVYPIYVIDENGQEDFYIRNRPVASGVPTMYFGG